MAEDFPYLIRNSVDWLWCLYNFLRITITPSSPEGKYILSLSIKLLDDLLIYGGVLGIIITGLIYGIWTK